MFVVRSTNAEDFENFVRKKWWSEKARRKLWRNWEREREKKKRNVCSFEGKKGGKVLTVTVLSFKKKITILLLGELECYGQYKWKLEKKNITNYLLNGILYWGFIKKAEQRQDLITHLTRNAWRRLSYLSIPKRKMSSLFNNYII